MEDKPLFTPFCTYVSEMHVVFLTTIVFAPKIVLRCKKWKLNYLVFKRRGGSWLFPWSWSRVKIGDVKVKGWMSRQEPNPQSFQLRRQELTIEIYSLQHSLCCYFFVTSVVFCYFFVTLVVALIKSSQPVQHSCHANLILRGDRSNAVCCVLRSRCRNTHKKDLTFWAKPLS